MGTHSNVYIETEKDVFVGVYCHYDGYPDHMLEQVNHCTCEEIYKHILVGGMQGGYRIFSPIDEKSEFLNDGIPYYIHDPNDEGMGVDYIYVKCLDGSLKWRYGMSNKWRFK